MTQRQFDNLWVGSIVHLDNWPWRVQFLNRQTGILLVRKMPEVASFGMALRTVHHSKLTYVGQQKPPIGQSFGEEEQRI